MFALNNSFKVTLNLTDYNHIKCKLRYLITKSAYLSVMTCNISNYQRVIRVITGVLDDNKLRFLP